MGSAGAQPGLAEDAAGLLPVAADGRPGRAQGGAVEAVREQHPGALILEGADVDRAGDDAGQAALVGRGRGGVVAGVEGRAAGQEGVGEGRAAVVLQGAEQGVDVQEVGAGEAAAAAGVADQVMAQRAEVAGQVGAGGGRVAGDDGVPGGERAEIAVVDAAAARKWRSCR